MADHRSCEYEDLADTIHRLEIEGDRLLVMLAPPPGRVGLLLALAFAAGVTVGAVSVCLGLLVAGWLW